MLLAVSLQCYVPDPRKDWPGVLLGLPSLPGSRASVVLQQERLASRPLSSLSPHVHSQQAAEVTALWSEETCAQPSLAGIAAPS